MDATILIAIGIVALGGAAFAFVVIVSFPTLRPAAAGAPRSGYAPARREPAGNRLTSKAPRGYVGWLERWIVYAGRQTSWTPGGLILAKVLATAGALLLTWIWILGEWSPVKVVLGFLLIVLAFFAPDIILYSRASDRQKLIANALPDTLDQMTIATEAGLGFDSAMQKAATNGHGPLAAELVRALQDMSIGQSRRDAYRALELRTNSEDFRRFIRAIIQADRSGISVADVLRVQADEMRIKRRQRAEEKAMKVPVKVVFPLVICILPVLFIVVLTPAIIGVFQSFSNL